MTSACPIQRLFATLKSTDVTSICCGMCQTCLCVCVCVRVIAVIDGAALKIDDRLRVAKERREEAERQQGERFWNNVSQNQQYPTQLC